ncbi:hypothetical protein EJ04DRAFT_509158 [Polyplosphaeria fusca]|uniref:Formylmethionine deformylase-like protein n=1 Tax=Polyplosphaeria fusca TaxID=682080 RepID=A0A9P4V771_9PLEO|nr:hypothetical protein EJ04DRAFT_509158 [Polyplosphaeria fusca]
MAVPGHRSPNSSRSVSPQVSPRPYDPFDPPLDPIEMSSFAQSSPRLEHQRGRSLGEASLADDPSSPHMGGHRGGKQYAPIPNQDSSHGPPQPSEASLYSMGSGLNFYKTRDADTQALVDRRAGELAQWHVHWSTPAIIAALFVGGVLGALGHHFFYAHLDGRPATEQLKMIRYGTALAFFVKSTLVGCVILCYRQRIWRTFRTKAMTINAIDGLFASTEDPTQFFMNWEMIRNGKLATLMAACSWLIPIASVLSPASLTSEVQTSYNLTRCSSVASLDFTHESLYNFRNESNFPGSSLVFYNTTDTHGKAPDYFDYYDQPSKNARRLAVLSTYLKKASHSENASIDSCGNGWNCTYSISFQGPGYNCDELANSSTPDLAPGTAPFNLTTLAPQGDYLYYSSVDMGEYLNPQIETGDDGVPVPEPPYPETLGVFQAEPVLWIGYVINTSKPYDAASSQYKKKWGTVHEPKIFKCAAYHTNYTFEVRYNDSNQITKRLERKFIAPVVDTTMVIDPTDSSQTFPSPQSNFIRPQDDEKYKLTAAHHAMGSLLRNFLRGSISYKAPYFVTKSDISETRLMEAATSYPIHNLMQQIQEMYEDMILTLLSEPHLVVANKEDVPCQKSRTVNVYVYHAEGLWVGYAIVVAITFAFIFVGAWSIHQNGVASDTLFSRIMVTTRNPTLDRLSVGACLGGDPFPKELIKTKLRFGVLLEEEPREGPLGVVEHCTFGAAGETKDIVKYGTYAGLKKWREDSDGEDGHVREKKPLLATRRGVD